MSGGHERVCHCTGELGDDTCGGGPARGQAAVSQSGGDRPLGTGRCVTAGTAAGPGRSCAERPAGGGRGARSPALPEARNGNGAGNGSGAGPSPQPRGSGLEH